MDSKRSEPRHRAGGKGKESHTKKQATPSQLRANHEKQQKGLVNAGKQDHAVKGPNEAKRGDKSTAAAAAAASNGKQVSAKVKSLHEQSDKSLEAYSKKAQEIKGQISAALERQDKFHQDERSKHVEALRESILELSGAAAEADGEQQQQQQQQEVATESEQQVSGETGGHSTETATPVASCPVELSDNTDRGGEAAEVEREAEPEGVVGAADEQVDKSQLQKSGAKQKGSSNVDNKTEPAWSVEQPVPNTVVPSPDAQNLTSDGATQGSALSNNCFEPLTARLDPKSKYVALKASLERHFLHSPHLLEPICQKFISLTDQIETLSLYNEQNQAEIQKLTSIKNKLGDLCRELQKSNNQIRIESLDLIKLEQSKAKDQAGKIQSTLSGVMKLFDENQQRNLTLKQENIELQGKLKTLLEHCDNWEKCVETTLKQRDIEIRLAKTEMARMSLLRNEEQKKLFKEKAELLKALTSMKEQQSKIEVSEAKLRADLTNYASKYDECQEIIHKGLSKFQVESKRMLKQIEQGRRDYVQLLNKYEASNKKIKQLLEEKQSWAQSMGAANNKLEALERLCRALKTENDRLLRAAGPDQSDQRQPVTVADTPTEVTKASGGAGESKLLGNAGPTG